MTGNSKDDPPKPGPIRDWTEPLEHGDKPQTRPTIREAAATIKTEDFANFARLPCVQKSLLTGIALGAGVGGLHLIVRGEQSLLYGDQILYNGQTLIDHTSGRPLVSGHFAVGTCVVSSSFSYHSCYRKRRQERNAVKRGVEIVKEQKTAQPAKQEPVILDQRSQSIASKAATQPWYKFW
jgi:hypothetical protein